MPAYVWALIHTVPAAWGVYHALLYKRDPRSAMGWIMICLFVPFAGPVAYFFFGINRVRKRARGLKRQLLAIDYEVGARKFASSEEVGSDLRRAGGRITGRSISCGNAISPLYNGESAYPVMLESISHASERVLLATYILKDGETGRAFAAALDAAAKRGVEVMVLVDGIGKLYSIRDPISRIKNIDIKVAQFLPPKLFPPSIYINLRNHRKLLVVDETVAYAGGMNISDEHTSTAAGPRTVSDVHFSLRGPVVSELAEVFFGDWYFATRSAAEKQMSVAAEQHGEVGCRVIPDGPDDEMDALALTIQAAISAASQSIDIVTPYFLPGRELTASLQSAVLRGVTVRIVLPGNNNLFYIHWAHRNTLTELLKWGIEVFYQPAPFCHSKILCVDRDYSLIGSANLDPRSLRLNFELGIENFSEKLNQELISHIDSLIAMSTPVSYGELANRSVRIRLRDSAAALFSPYL